MTPLLEKLNGLEGGGFIVTPEQLKAAVAIAEKDRSDFGSKACWYTLNALGFERCECMKHEHIAGVCQNCHGIGAIAAQTINAKRST